jgi:hypothetical protein
MARNARNIATITSRPMMMFLLSAMIASNLNTHYYYPFNIYNSFCANDFRKKHW